MTIDERLQVLLQSTESLHATAHELTGQIAENGRQIAAHSKQLAQDSENIRALARIAEIHDRRLTDLEGGG